MAKLVYALIMALPGSPLKDKAEFGKINNEVVFARL